MKSALNIPFPRADLRGWVIPVFLYLTWEIASHSGKVSSALVPSPELVGEAFLEFAKNGVLWYDIKESLICVFKACALGASAGFLLGASMGLSAKAETLVGPLFHAVRQVPLVGWVPLVVLWVGPGEMSQVVIVSFGAFYPVVLNTFQGIRGVRHEYVEVAQVFEYSWPRLLTRVILPAAVPSIFTGLRIGLSTSWMLIVASELLTSSSGGLGSLLLDGREHLRMDAVFVGIISIAVIGGVMNWTLGSFQKRLLKWKKTY